MLVALRPASLWADASSDAEQLAQQVEIERTNYGVPHIEGENLRAAAFGLGYVQMEDYGEEVLRRLLEARGEKAKYFGREHVEDDVTSRLAHDRAVETYHRLSEEVRDIKEGFAEGVNHFIRTYEGDEDMLPAWAEPDFTGHDVAARDIGWAEADDVGDFVDTLKADEEDRVRSETYEVPADNQQGEDGSNSWALAPSRTTSGNAILVRNPHLSWEAGYYEVHFTVPDVINFYGDFRIGGPFTTIGGFNQHLGFSTTNNGPRNHEIYALEVDPETPDHYRFDGASVPIQRDEVTVEFESGEGLATETHERLSTPLGPVIHRGDGWIYVLRDGNHGEYRVGEQLFRMMTATSLEEWKEAAAMRARPRSNFVYADREGNIHYLWNASTPSLPHPAGGDTLAVPASSSSDVWSSLVPYDSLPSLTNPTGGYVRNENDSFHFTNLHEPLDEDDFPDHFEDPSLRLRSQHALELLHNQRVFTLEEVVELKHSTRMLLADRVKEDLLDALQAEALDSDVAEAADLIDEWDNRVAAESEGAVLFRTWWNRYRQQVGTDVSPMVEDPGLFREPWTQNRPMETPHGLADREAAVDAFEEAVDVTADRWGSWDVAWGDVHRARRGNLDLPVGGCAGVFGCIRVLWFENGEDGKRRVRGGDGWVFAVEFGEQPRAYSVLAYGQSAREDSPYHTNQLRTFARNDMKRVPFTDDERAEVVERIYHPGEEAESSAD